MRHHLTKLKKPVAVVVAWMLWFAAWARVETNGTAPTLAMLLAPVAIAVAAVLIVHIWVRHNRALHTRLGPRRSSAPYAMAYSHDRLGRPLTVDATPSTAPRWREIDLVVRDGEKHYYRADTARAA